MFKVGMYLINNYINILTSKVYKKRLSYNIVIVKILLLSVNYKLIVVISIIIGNTGTNSYAILYLRNIYIYTGT